MGRRVRVCVVRGPLAPWAAGFESWLAARGYSPSAIYNRACLLASLPDERLSKAFCTVKELDVTRTRAPTPFADPHRGVTGA